MQKEFNKLSLEKKRKFIVRNLLNDKYFNYFHNDFNNIFIEDIYSKNKQKEMIITRNKYINNKITKILNKYKNYIIDLSYNPNNDFFYKKANKQKIKLINILNPNVLNYKDEFDFTVRELILDTMNDTKNIIIDNNLSLETIINHIS